VKKLFLAVQALSYLVSADAMNGGGRTGPEARSDGTPLARVANEQITTAEAFTPAQRRFFEERLAVERREIAQDLIQRFIIPLREQSEARQAIEQMRLLQGVLQRFVGPLQQQFDLINADAARDGEVFRRALADLRRGIEQLGEFSGGQAEEIQRLRRQEEMTSVNLAFSLGAISPQLMPHHIDKTATGISRKVTIQERHDAVSAVYEQLKLLQTLLPRSELTAIRTYVENTRVEKIIVPEVSEPRQMPTPVGNGNRGQEIEWGGHKAWVRSDIRRWLEENGVRVPDWWGNGGGENSEGTQRYRNILKPQAEKRYRERREAYAAYKKKLEENEARYRGDIARAERVPFPAAELDRLITQFNGLLTLHLS
jgi:hypothetical protein